MNKFIKLFILTSLYITIFSAVSYAGFEDVKGHWCEEKINNFNKAGFVEGYEDKTFRPDDDITRAELCKIINAYMNYETSGEWQNANMEVAKEKGYLTTGEANSNITREEAFTVLAKVMKIDQVDFNLEYSDIEKISNWAMPAIKSLTAMGYLKGYENNEIKPSENLSRAELVEILYDFVGIGGVDEEIENVEFTIGYLSYNKYGVEFIEIPDELEIQSGDIITLASTASLEDEVEFQILAGKELVDFDDKTLMLEAIASGEVEVLAKSLNEKKKVVIKIK